MYSSNQDVIICGIAESDAGAVPERIQSDLKQFTETVSSIFKNSQEIRVLKDYTMGSTYYNYAGEQSPHPLKAILKPLNKLIYVTDIRVNSGDPFVFKRKTGDERASDRANT